LADLIKRRPEYFGILAKYYRMQPSEIKALTPKELMEWMSVIQVLEKK
jgi:hypothetical protein